MLLLALAAAWPLQRVDDALQRAVQSWRRPPLEGAMRVASDAGRPLLVGGALLGLALGPPGRAVVGELAVALVPVNLAVEALKWATDRTRPDGERRRSNSSFPSSHAANAAAVALVLARRFRRGAAGFFALAAVVAFSRVYLNRHYPSDVLAGAALGLFGAWAGLRLWTRLRRGRVVRAPD